MPKACHVDVKRAAASSLLDLLETATPVMTETIFVALESIVLVAKNFNKRRPITEDAWIEAEASKSPPKLDDYSPETSPLLYILTITFPHYKPLLHKRYAERMVLLILERLQKETKHWMQVFFSSISVPASVTVSPSMVEELPPLPRHVEI